ncbi:MAG: hypothetical protein IPH77_00015 [Ignavibacteria bacterium]|nr:hypothetical protein [Ignavibacteria bacterium]
MADLVDFVKYLDESEKSISGKPIFISGDRENVQVEVAFQYNESYNDNTYTFVIRSNDTRAEHILEGFNAALTRTLNNYATRIISLKSDKDNSYGDDFQEGLMCNQHWCNEPQF